MLDQIHAITLPKLGLTMYEGSVAVWNIDLGSAVKEGEEIADIETEKITVGYESPVSGMLRKTVAEIGATLPVGALIAVIADASVTDKTVDTFIEDFEPNTSL